MQLDGMPHLNPLHARGTPSGGKYMLKTMDWIVNVFFRNDNVIQAKFPGDFWH